MSDSRWRSTSVGSTAVSARFLSTIVVAFLLMLGFSLVGPLVPTVVDEFGVSRAGAGLLLTSFAAGRLAFNLVAGMLGDRYGIRQVAVVACLLTAAASLVAAYTDSYTILLGARVVQGTGSALYMTVALGFVLHVAPEGHVAKLLSLHQGAILLAITVGPGIGGVTAELWGIRGTFLVYGGLALLGFLPSLRWLPGREIVMDDDTDPDIERTERRAALRRLITDRSFLVVMVAGFMVFWIRTGVGSTVLPLFAFERFGLSEMGVGLMLMVSALGNLVVLWHAGNAIDERGRRTVLVRSMVGLSLVVAAFGLMVDLWIVFALSLALGVVKGYAAVVPSAVLSDLADPRIRNTGVGILRMTTDGGILLGPVLSGGLVDLVGYESSFVWFAVLTVAVTIGVFMMRETSRSGPAAAI